MSMLPGQPCRCGTKHGLCAATFRKGHIYGRMDPATNDVEPLVAVIRGVTTPIRRSTFFDRKSSILDIFLSLRVE